jgi:Domain of Unknown Function (DUF1259)
MRFGRLSGLAVLLTLTASQKPARAGDPIDWAKVGEALGKAGEVQPGGVYRVGLPRSDLHVTVGGVQIKPALALGSWVGFQPAGSGVTAMGDLVLLEREVGLVTAKLQESGIEQTAIHNHLLHETPHVMYVHIRAHGDPVEIARAIHGALTLTGTPFGAAGGKTGNIGLDTARIHQILGWSGKVNGGVYQVSVPRAEVIREGDMEVPPAMGVATGLNFQPTGASTAAITGDFVLISKEVNPVLHILQQNGIEVTALHSHMLDESPRLFFMHFWANDDAMKLARGLRAALDKMNVKPAS